MLNRAFITKTTSGELDFAIENGTEDDLLLTDIGTHFLISRLTEKFEIDKKIFDRQEISRSAKKFLNRQKITHRQKKFSINKINSQSTKNFSTGEKNCLTDVKVFPIL